MEFGEFLPRCNASLSSVSWLVFSFADRSGEWLADPIANRQRFFFWAPASQWGVVVEVEGVEAIVPTG